MKSNPPLNLNSFHLMITKLKLPKKNRLFQLKLNKLNNNLLKCKIKPLPNKLKNKLLPKYLINKLFPNKLNNKPLPNKNKLPLNNLKHNKINKL